MNARGAFVSVAFGVVLGAGLTVWWNQAPPPDELPPTTRALAIAADAVASESAAAPTRMLVADATYAILDGRTRAPVPTARLIPIAEEPQPCLPTDDAAAVHVDDSGCVPTERLRSSRDWLVHAPGYTAVVVREPSRAGQLLLTAAASLSVVVSHEHGDPAEGALVVAYPVAAPPLTVDATWAANMCGDPRHPRPTWATRADGNGMALLDTLPPGTFRVEVVHDEAFCVSPAGQGESHVVAPGLLHVTLLDLYAVCVAAPSERSFSSHSWIVPREVDSSPALLRSKDRARRCLASRFPGSVSYVGRPRNPSGGPLLVGCRAMMENGTAGTVDWPLTPIRDITSPVFLAVDESVVYRAVNIRVVTLSGESIPMCVRCTRIDVDGARPVQRGGSTDEDILLHPGRYRVDPENAAPWLRPAFAGAIFTIASEGPPTQQLTIRLHEELRLLVLSPQAPQGTEFRGFAHFAITAAEDRGSYGVMNWTPARGPIECLMPPGRIGLRVDSPFYGLAGPEILLERGREPLRVDLRLSARSSTDPIQGGAPEPAGGR